MPVIIPYKSEPVLKRIIKKSNDWKGEEGFLVPMTLNDLLLIEKNKLAKKYEKNMYTGLRKR